MPRGNPHSVQRPEIPSQYLLGKVASNKGGVEQGGFALGRSIWSEFTLVFCRSLIYKARMKFKINLLVISLLSIAAPSLLAVTARADLKFYCVESSAQPSNGPGSDLRGPISGTFEAGGSFVVGGCELCQRR